MNDAPGQPPIRPVRPARPEPPARTDGKAQGGSLVPILLVGVPLLTFAAGLVLFLGRAGVLILIAIASLPAFILMHYLLWGRWLRKALSEQPTEDPPRPPDPFA